MPEIKRIVETREVCYYDGTNGQYILDVFFADAGYVFVSEVGGVLTLSSQGGAGEDLVLPVGQYAVRNYKGDGQIRWSMTQENLDAYYSVIGTVPS